MVHRAELSGHVAEAPDRPAPIQLADRANLSTDSPPMSDRLPPVMQPVLCWPGADAPFPPIYPGVSHPKGGAAMKPFTSGWALLLLALVLSACQALVAAGPVPRPEIAAKLPRPVPTRIPPAAPTLDESTLGWVNRMVEASMAVNEIPGFAIGIIRHGQIVYATGYGVAELGTARAMTPQTLAPAASLSTQFTAAAILQLAAQGEVNLDAPVADYLPDIVFADSRFAAVTVRHLLANNSGLPQPDSAASYDFTRRASTPDELHRYLAGRTLAAAPGARFIFSSDNGDLLSAIVTKVSGLPFEEYVAAHLLAPAGMTQSTFRLVDADASELTAAHWLNAHGAPVASRTPPDYDQLHAGATGLVTNIDDLLAWAALSLDHGRRGNRQVVPADAYAAMWTPHASFDDEFGGLFEQWGLGWALADEQGHRVAWWGGMSLGSNMMLFLAPDDDIAVVTLANATRESTGPPWYSYSVGYSILQLLLEVQVGGT